MVKKFFRLRSWICGSGAPLKEREPCPSLIMEVEVYGVFIVRFIQMIHDRILVKNRKRWGSYVFLDLRFPNSDPQNLASVTANVPGDSKTQKDMLKELKSAERKTCLRLDWPILLDWIEERKIQVVEEFERFTFQLAERVNRGRLTVDVDMTANPPVDSPSKDSGTRLLQFQIRFHALE